jgi:FAD synthase
MSGVYDSHKLYTTGDGSVSTLSTDVSTNSEEVSTSNIQRVVSTNDVDSVDKFLDERFAPVFERMAAIEERLGKLRA